VQAPVPRSASGGTRQVASSRLSTSSLQSMVVVRPRMGMASPIQGNLASVHVASQGGASTLVDHSFAVAEQQNVVAEEEPEIVCSV